MTAKRWLAVVLALVASPALAAERDVTALGRLEPAGGVIHVSGPSSAGSVLAELRVAEGEDVEEDQILAVLDTKPTAEARVARLEAELRDAESKLEREKTLQKTGATSQSSFDAAVLGADVARAELLAAKAELDLSLVRAPRAGRVLEIHTQRGERIGPKGLLELGQVRDMRAIAEVYETDIALVRVGQPASVSSPALPEDLSGKVTQIGQKVGKLDVLGTDPTAVSDARVIEVEIVLDEPAAAETLTNLQVDVRIRSDAP